MKRALEEVKTAFVMVVQHDRDFTRAVSAKTVLEVMHDSKLPFVGFSTRATQNHARRCRDKGLIGQKDFEEASKPVFQNETFSILPLLVWYDSTHIATK